MTRRFFITATGTDQGKTWLTTLLCEHLQMQGAQVEARKPVISGYDGSLQTDTARILTSLGKPVTELSIAAMSPWRFVAPLSPDRAAAKENTAIEWQALLEYCHHPVQAETDWLFLEGAGGLMSPLTAQQTNLDLVLALQWPVILVSASYLGCISHILTSLAVLQQHRLTVAALVLSQADRNALAIEEVLHSLQPHLPIGLPMVTLPHNHGDRRSYISIIDPLTEKLADVERTPRMA